MQLCHYQYEDKISEAFRMYATIAELLHRGEMGLLSEYLKITRSEGTGRPAVINSGLQNWSISAG